MSDKDSIPLSKLRAGEKACVYDICIQDSMRRRLQDMGLIPGAVVECVAVSPLGDPTAYRIRGAVIALRRTDSIRVRVRREGRELKAAAVVCGGQEAGSID